VFNLPTRNFVDLDLFAQILFFGAEFTQVYANHYGSKIVPDPDMMKITEQERAEKGILHEKTMRKANR